jgi:hypothetical protein
MKDTRSRSSRGQTVFALKALVRPLITSGIVMVGIFALALIPALDRRGLPGGLFATAILLILVLLAVRVVLGEFPPRGRRRALAAAASAEGLRFRIRPRIPRSMKALPSFSDQRTFGADAWNLIAFRGEPVVLTFDRRLSRDAYESPTWVASAAGAIDFEAPSVVVEPRPVVTADPLGDLVVRSSESAEFARRFRIRTEDRLFSTAFLDQRMLAWILEQSPGWTFEVGGRWAMVSTADLRDQAGPRGAVDVLRGFCGHFPPVAASLRRAGRAT